MALNRAAARIIRDDRAVVLDVDSDERMVDELALPRDVRLAEEEVAAGKVRSHSTVARTLRARLKR